MTEQSEKLKPFSSFSKEMAGKYLQPLDKRHRDSLIRKLYRAAARKQAMETIAQDYRARAPECRSETKTDATADTVFANLLQQFREAKQLIDPLTQEDFGFDEVEEHLVEAAQYTVECECSGAARIHPKLRTPKEQRLARKLHELGEYRGMEDRCHVPYPLSEKSRQFDHWLIGRAEKLLSECEATSGQHIERHDLVISELFKHAFGESNEESDRVRAELRRQKEKGTPKLPSPSAYKHSMVAP